MFFDDLKESAKQLKQVKAITGAAVLAALDVVLGMFTIRLTTTLEISFSFLAKASIGVMYGPVIAALCGGVTDIIKYFLNPSGGFMVLFTLIEVTSGFLYGAMLYKRKITFWRCLGAKTVVSVICNLMLTPLVLHVMYGTSVWVLLFARLPKNLLLLLPESIAMYFVVSQVVKIKEKLNR